MRDVAEGPLVSVGIPTYNRAAGLRRTLACITAQTYKNLQIIVSDNGSPGAETREVVEEFASIDSRVRYVRQPHNLGPQANFQYVLREATGDLFMWAADDDEWDPGFIDFCVRNIGQSGGIMTAFTVHNRVTGAVTKIELPDLSGARHNARDISRFVRNMQPTLFYGLHRREALGFFLEDTRSFDWMDCHICMQLIWDSGFVTRNDACLYTAGIDHAQYQVKTTGAKRLNPLPFVRQSLIYGWRSRNPLTLLRLLKFLLRRHS